MMPSVLIVENNEFFRQSFREILKMHLPECSIEDTPDGEDALRRIDLERPDFVFMDIRLNGQNGLDLTREIKKSHPQTFVSIFTNHDFPEYRDKATDCGADYFLLKDCVSGADLARLVRTVIAQKASLAGGAGTTPHLPD